MDPTRRKILKVGAGAAAMAAVPNVVAQQGGQAQQSAQEKPVRFYERGPVRIAYDEAGSGFPLMLIAGGALESTMAGLVRPLQSHRAVEGRIPLHLRGPAQRRIHS